MKRPLTIGDIEDFAESEVWGGYGYCNARHLAHRTAVIDAADTMLIEVANEQGWTLADLRTFLDSKVGRWYGEEYIMGNGPAAARKLIARVR